MSDFKTHIPVFLPGNERDFDEVAGVATINEAGQIVIDLQHPEHGMHLAELLTQGKLIDCSFDYTPED